MGNVRSLQRSFNGGELSGEMFGQVTDGKVQSGLATCRNFIVLPHGPVTNRPGTTYVRAVKDSTKRTRLIPFSYSTTQTMVIELGVGYFRFHTNGQHCSQVGRLMKSVTRTLRLISLTFIMCSRPMYSR